MDTEKMRAEFEAWVKTFNEMPAALFQHTSGEYVDDWIQARWLGWQASRAAIVIELPPKQRPAVDDDENWHNIRNSTIDACRRAIEAAGLTVKE